MVKIQSTYDVELVDAVTKIPFKEHTSSDGKVYIEVEPNAEYLVKIDVNFDQRVKAKLEIDGENIGYYTKPWLYKKGKCLMGFTSMVSGKYETYSFKFASTLRGESIDSTPFIGTVKVIFEEAIADGKFNNEDWTTNLNNDEKFSSLGKKIVRTKKGTYIHEDNEEDDIPDDHKYYNDYEMKFKSGRILKETEIKYCTTLGLISAGVIPKPPLWDLARLKRPMQLNLIVRNDGPTLKKVKIPTRFSIDGEVMETKEVACFDMSIISDSEDEK